MRLELQELRAQSMTDAFKQIGFQSGTGGGYGTSDIVSNQQNMSNQKDYV